MAQGISCQNLTIEAQVQSQASLFEICGGQSGTRIGAPLSTLVFPCQYHSTNAPFSLIHSIHSFIIQPSIHILWMLYFVAVNSVIKWHAVLTFIFFTATGAKRQKLKMITVPDGEEVVCLSFWWSEQQCKKITVCDHCNVIKNQCNSRE